MSFIFKVALAVLFLAACADAVGQDKWWLPKHWDEATYFQKGEGIEVDNFPASGFGKYAEDKNSIFFELKEGGLFLGYYPILFDVQKDDIIFARTFYNVGLDDKNKAKFTVYIASEDGSKTSDVVVRGKGARGGSHIYASQKSERLCVDFQTYGSTSYKEYANSAYDYIIMRYGHLVSYELRPANGQTIEKYVSGKDFKSMSEEAIIATLSDDFLCDVTDSYGNKVTVACADPAWNVDTETAMASYGIVYFAPLSLLSTDLNELVEWPSMHGVEWQSIKLWDASSQTSVANVFDNDDVDVTVDGHTILSASGRKTYVYSLSGSLVGIAADGHMNVPEGMYIVKQGFQTKKVTVKP